jgi:hypothetical protein
MAMYAATFARTADTTYAVGNITASSSQRRTRWTYLSLGFIGTPADAAAHVQVKRCSTTGTGSSVTIRALDDADLIATATARENLTANPTVSEILLSEACHQRATLRWWAGPGGGLITPATTSYGLAILTPVAPEIDVVSTVHFEEL